MPQTPNARRPWFGLRARLVMMTMTVTLATTAVVSALAFVHTRRTEEAMAFGHIQAQAVLQADRIEAVFARTEADMELLSGLPPIDGIPRTLASPNGRDPRDGSTLAFWQDRLRTIMQSFLNTRPHYLSLEMLLPDTHAHWQVMAERHRYGAAPPALVPAADLNEFARGLGGEGFFLPSLIDANGRMVRDYLQVFRADDTRATGLLRVRLDLAVMLGSAGVEALPGMSLAVVTGDGHQFDLTGTSPPNLVEWLNGMAPLRRGDFREAGRLVIFTAPIELARAAPHSGSLRLVSTISEATLHARSTEVLNTTIWASVALTLVAGLLAGLAGRGMTAPLRRLTRAVSEHDESRPLILPPAGRDEIGKLSNAFSDLAARLLEQTARTQAIFDGVGDSIIAINADGRIRDINETACLMLGYTRGALMGARVEMLMPPDDAAAHAGHIATSSAGPRAQRMAPARDIYGQRADGTLVPLEISVTRIQEEESHYFIGVLRDVTERRAAEAKLRALIDALKRSNSELDTFAYIASHDLKAPLRVIDNASRWLEEDLEQYLTDDTRESMELLRSRVARMERLLDDLLAHSRIGRTEVDTTLVSGDRIVADLRGLLNIPDGMSLVTGPGFEEIALPTMPITTILINLINNAIKHHDRDTGRIDLTVDDTGEFLLFRVADDGPGIPPEYHDRIFQMFQTLRPRDQVDGSGMGLAMVRKYADMAGGQVNVVSGEGRGTVFELFWPKTAGARPDDSAPPAADRTAEKGQAA